MGEADAWLELIRRSGLFPWQLDGDRVTLAKPPPFLAGLVEPARPLPLTDLFGPDAAAVRQWTDGAGDPVAAFTLSPAVGGGDLILVRGPGDGNVRYGTVRLPGEAQSGRARAAAALTTAMIQAAGARRRVAVALIGIRDFDLVRDGLGIPAADRVFDEVVDRITHGNGTVVICRLDSGCIAVILSDRDADAAMDRVAGLMDAAFATPVVVDGMFHRLNGRAGVSVFPDDATSVEDLMHAGSLALSVAVRSRHRQVVRVETGWLDRVRDEVHLASEMVGALADHQFRFDLQPIMDLRTGRVGSAEALARWIHPEMGRIPPDRFVPLAERQDLLLDVTIAMLRRLARDLRDTALPPLRIAVNVAPADFSWHRIGRLVDAIRHESLIPLDRLTLEITESGMMEDLNGEAHGVAGALRTQGITTAIDDFGTGYSSFASLGSLPIDILKIDRSLAHDVHLRPDQRRMLAAITNMASVLGLSTVVEGLECAEEVEVVRDLGCDRVQGFVFSRPLDVSGLAGFCARHGLH